MNRVWWDLQGERSTQIKLRTKPIYGDWVDMPEEGWRSGGPRISVLQLPGTYSVVLEANGQEYSQELTVLKDPNSEGTLAEIVEQTAMVEEIQQDLESAAEIVNQIELIRRQMYDLKVIVEAQGDDSTILAAVDEFDEKLIEVEGQLIQMKNIQGGDGVRWASMIVDRISYLARNVGTADFKPNDQQKEVHLVLRDQLQRARQQFEVLIQTDLPAFNRLLEQRSVPRIISE